MGLIAGTPCETVDYEKRMYARIAVRNVENKPSFFDGLAEHRDKHFRLRFIVSDR